MLVQGFRSGQLNLKREVPPELAQIADPSAALANPAERDAWHDLNWVLLHGLHDLSYYRGKLYLYFGVTPALVLFWPWYELSGHYLLQGDAVLIFFSMGFLLATGLLRALQRRYFAELGVWPAVAGTLALGLANFIPPLLVNPAVSEVAISCGYSLTMLALVALWCAWHQPLRRGRWLAVASLAHGLAVGARPSLLLGAIILLMPVLKARREKQAVWPLLMAATAPFLLVGLGLMLYNTLRFDNPLEFGQRYQLPASWHQQFSPAFFWFNFRVGFLEMARWSSCFPFVQQIIPPPLPENYFVVENAFGVLTNLPVVWLALAAPLAWRGRLGEERSSLRWFSAALVLLFGACALPLVLHDSMCLRYQAEFASPLVWLGILGIFALERALADRPGWRQATRWVWGLLLAFSVAFNLFVRFLLASQTCYHLGAGAAQRGQPGEAIAYFREALQMRHENPDAHMGLGTAFFQLGQFPEAIRHWEQVIALRPEDADAHFNLGVVFLQSGKVPEATVHLDHALRIRPEDATARNNLVAALMQQGQTLGAQGRGEEAIQHYQRAIQLKPDYAPAHDNAGITSSRQGKFAEAVKHYQKALEMAPGLVSARNHLAWMLATCPDGSVRDGRQAVQHAEQANREAGSKDPMILDTLAAAYAEAGRFSDAVRTAQTALELAKQAGQVEQARRIQERLEWYQAGRAYRDGSTAAP